MSEKDFVIAWLLATRAGGERFDVEHQIREAEKIWKHLEERYETNG